MNRIFIISLMITIVILFVFTVMYFRNNQTAEQILNRSKKILPLIMYYLMMFGSTFFYIIITLILQNYIILNVIAPLILLIVLYVSIRVVNNIFVRLFDLGQLTIDDQKRYISAMCMSSFVLGLILVVKDNIKFLEITGISFSLFLGFAIKSDILLSSENIKTCLINLVNQIVEFFVYLKNNKLAVFTIALGIAIPILSSYDIVNNIIEGIGTGTTVFYIIFYLYGSKNKDILKNKIVDTPRR